MLQNDINKFIMEAMKAGDAVATDSYRDIKNEFMKFKTAKNTGVLDEAQEINIIRKMVKERKENAQIYSDANRQELADKELAEAAVIEKFLPAQVDPSVISNYIAGGYPAGIEQKQMGIVIKEVKTKFPTADGKIVADIVKSFIK